MKKIVPDPPALKLVNTLYPSIHPDLLPPDALAVASDMLLGISEVIDAHCRANAGEKGMMMLANARHSADIAHALIEHALVRL
ncbi:hypothetical protein SJI00_14985 [Pseudomonas sp. RP23018S]|uniref:hypothetical protein n=1 Tax=Pseudomonas sp. RP23018S TaxID=3096037 RepID=UPI002ACA5130|nr:hypothetical protein [Pseudomonas sp. RP23018S]MDZ5604079.1 hypothetical protein [Pseudomonas sp. RP23018S]